jgi:hypothetical protein
MYYPYFRGKQYELVTIRETARSMQRSVVPIIEQVRHKTYRPLVGLQRAVEALIEARSRFILIANPRCGDLCRDPDRLEIMQSFINSIIKGYDNWSLGYIADEFDEPGARTELANLIRMHADLSIIHDGFPNAAALAGILADIGGVSTHLFLEEKCSRLYRRNFRDKTRILIRDGFNLRIANREYPDIEQFSDLHITYEEEGMNGFGDFLTVGRNYSETGGPAYTVAIHITFINRDADDEIFIKHYKSAPSATAADPGGKFFDALTKLVSDATRGDTQIYRSNAITEFLRLHETAHYPGLGYIKKLSMQHHLEMLTNYLERV